MRDEDSSPRGVSSALLLGPGKPLLLVSALFPGPGRRSRRLFFSLFPGPGRRTLLLILLSLRTMKEDSSPLLFFSQDRKEDSSPLLFSRTRKRTLRLFSSPLSRTGKRTLRLFSPFS